MPRLVPKRQRAGAVQDASRGSGAIGQRASVLDCGGPPPLFSAFTKFINIFQKPSLFPISPRRDDFAAPCAFHSTCQSAGAGAFQDAARGARGNKVATNLKQSVWRKIP